MIVRANDGVPLNVLCSDMRHDDTLVLVNAPGIRCNVAERLMTELAAEGVNLVSWDLRGSPGDGAAFRTYRTAHHVDDLSAILKALSPKRVALASWCSGTPTALAAIREKRLAPTGFAAFCVPNFAGVARRSMPGDTLEKVCGVVVRDEEKAGYFFEATVARSGLDKLTADLPDARLRELVLAPFRSGTDPLLRYAHAIVNRPDAAEVRAWCGDLTVPTTFVGGRQDAMVSYEDTIALAELAPGASCQIVEHWNHYGLFYDMAVVIPQIQSLFEPVCSQARA